MTAPTFLAIDLGAESGHVMLGRIDDRLTLDEIHRFSNGPVRVISNVSYSFPA